MDVVQLERFLRIDAVGSFRAAARSLSLSQAALSSSMQQLESELGGPLFDRSGSGARLSSLGRTLKPRAEVIVAQTGRLKDDARAALGQGASSLSVGTTESLAAGVMSRAAGALLSQLPDLELRMSYADSDTMLQRLRTGELDLVLCTPKAGADFAGFEFEPTYEVRFVLAARAAHPIFRTAGTITLAAAHAHGWIMHERASPLFAALPGGTTGVAARQATVRVRAPAHALTKAMLLGTDLLGYVAEDVIQSDVDEGRIRIIDLQDVTTSRRAGILVRKDAPASRAAKLLCREIRVASRDLRRSRNAIR